MNPWKRQKELEKILTKSYLVKEYIDNKKTPLVISRNIKCGSTTIRNYLKKYNILLRNASKSAKLRYANSLIYQRFLKNYKFIKIEYLQKLRPIHIIAKKLKCSYKYLRDYMIKMQIPIRNKSECQQGKLNHMYGYNGKLNPNWQKGISKLPYSFTFTKELKYKIRKRDNFKCQNCFRTEEQEFQKFNKALSIHHINYDKENCHRDNLITLCHSCNIKANFDRDYWFAYYKYIMENYK